MAEAKTPILDTIHEPKDLKQLSHDELKQCADELRQDVIHQISKTGGHLGAGLGVVELTLALHSVFDTPHDRLIFDVGHQAYPHKILTKRRKQMHSLRTKDGLSGFTNRAESAYDPFGAGHSSTAMSAGLGMAVASDLAGQKRHVICVVGDGAMSAGMAYEAMNNAGMLKIPLIVILNDNDMSIARPVGAMSAYLSRLLSSRPYLSLREIGKTLADLLPKPFKKSVARAEEYARGMVSGGGTLFEELGFYYVGPIDGHNLDHLMPVLRNVAQASMDRPILLHVVTKKGAGYPPAEAAEDKYHGVVKFDVDTGKQHKTPSNLPSYTGVFSQKLIQLAKQDQKIIAITAAMSHGTGLEAYAKAHPSRYFDVGIAEQHAVTFAAGLACEGYKPFCAIYSTFLQRAYDQLIHDVAIQSLPVRFILDRAGYVGADGATHCGAFDLGYLSMVPNMIVMAPANEAELVRMMDLMRTLDHCPSALRFPRGNGTGAALPEHSEDDLIQVGKGQIIRKGEKLAILSLGTRLGDAMLAADQIKADFGISPTLFDARFAKPLDEDKILELARSHQAMIIIEEGAIGGFSSHVLHLLSRHDALSTLKIRALVMPDHFIEQMSQSEQLRLAKLDCQAIIDAATELF